MKLLGAIVFLLAVLAFPVLTQEKDLPPAQTELINAERAFAKLAVERGVRESFIAYFADDGIGFAPHPHVNSALLRPLPYKDSDRLFMVWERPKGTPQGRNSPSPANFIDWRDQSQVFEGMAAMINQVFN